MKSSQKQISMTELPHAEDFLYDLGILIEKYEFRLGFSHEALAYCLNSILEDLKSDDDE